ncbi:hypothetical protein ACFQJC_14465 [Haloferax namakaokahaiae]|uniref:Uncharacterized protein n=1 Tax=Haloferax namakaokahaiae TaxID=1748331 RepID=A0ABD5ZHE8_9EURY
MQEIPVMWAVYATAAGVVLAGTDAAKFGRIGVEVVRKRLGVSARYVYRDDAAGDDGGDEQSSETEGQ